VQESWGSEEDDKSNENGARIRKKAPLRVLFSPTKYRTVSAAWRQD